MAPATPGWKWGGRTTLFLAKGVLEPPPQTVWGGGPATLKMQKKKKFWAWGLLDHPQAKNGVV